MSTEEQDFDRKAFEKAVKTCGLSKAEVAAAYGTSRQTIYNQLKGGEPTSLVLVRTYNKVSKGLLNAIDKAVLPFPGIVSKEERKRRIASIVKVLHASK